MIQQTKWFDRTFDFSYPIGVFPCLLERLRGTPGRIEELMRLYPHSMLTTRVDGRWSMQEHVGHLVDLDELHQGRVSDYLAGAKVLRPADVKNERTKNANHNASSIDTILRNFRSARHRFVYTLENLDESRIELVAEHPRLQRPMRLIDMAYFVAEHDDHHLACVTDIYRQLGQ